MKQGYKRTDTIHKPEQCDEAISKLMVDWGISEEQNELIFHKCVGLRIRKRRLSLEMTQTEFAKLMKVTFQQVQKYESGKNGISNVKLVILCENTHTDLNYFFTFLVGKSITIKDGGLNNAEERPQS